MQLPNTGISERVLVVVAMCGALFALFMHFGVAKTNLSRSAWKVAADHIRQHYKPGDAIGLLPHWALKGAEPLGGLPVLYAPRLHAEDLSRYRRLWVLQAPRLGRWWFRRAHKPVLQGLTRRYWRQGTWHFGWHRAKGQPRRFGLQPEPKGLQQLSVCLVRLPPAPALLYDFQARRRLRKAEVHLELPASPRRVGRCRASRFGELTPIARWQEQPGWFRGRGDYFFGRIIQEIGDTPRDCLYAQPQACQVLRVRFRNVPLRGELRIDHGFTTPAPAKVAATVPPAGPDILLSIWAENRMLKRLRISQRQRWRTQWIQLKSFPRARGSVEFHVQTPGRKRRVGYCFRATLRDQPRRNPPPAR